MKYFIAIALIAAVASGQAIIRPKDLSGLSESQMAEVQQILDAIHSPSTDPTTAVMLEQMLQDLLGLSPAKPPINIPAIIDEFEPIHVGPALVDDFHPIDISPEIVDFPVIDNVDVEAPVPELQAPSKSPLVQIIVNVNQQDGSSIVSPVEVDHVNPSPVVVVDKPEPSIIRPTPVHVVEEAEPSIIKPTPVHVVEVAGESVFKPTPVDVVEQPILAEPVVVAPVIVAPAVVGPDSIN